MRGRKASFRVCVRDRERGGRRGKDSGSVSKIDEFDRVIHVTYEDILQLDVTMDDLIEKFFSDLPSNHYASQQKR